MKTRRPKSRTVAKKLANKPKPAAARRARKPKRVIQVVGQPTRWPREIKLDKVVKRRNMGDLAGLAKSIDERGCLLQPIPIDKDNFMIAGQRRLAAWPLSKYRKEPIPVHVIDVDSVLAGERDENA